MKKIIIILCIFILGFILGTQFWKAFHPSITWAGVYDNSSEKFPDGAILVVQFKPHSFSLLGLRKITLRIDDWETFIYCKNKKMAYVQL